MQAEPLIHWSEPVAEYAGFVGSFLAAGAVGFRYAVLRRVLASATGATPSDQRLYRNAAFRAARIGLVGALLGLLTLALALPDLAARRHLTVAQLVTGNPQTALGVALAAAAVLGFLLAARQRGAGWPLAAVGVIAGMLPALFAGELTQLVNPVHRLAGALWLGTLFVLVTAGLVTVLREEPSGERRGAIVADMVNAFSPLALAMAVTLVLFGVITAWQHLKYVAALWTTPYGWTLITKLCVVSVVFSLGAWNWRRQRPLLGSESAALSIRRSATAELVAAAIVLAITSVLVSLPTPKLPHPPPLP